MSARLSALIAAIVTIVALAGPAAAASFTVVGDRIVVSGTLYGDRDFEKFSALVRANPDIKTIRLKDFFGGVWMEAFLLYPKFIRERGLSTEFEGPCISACSLVFIGGVTRRLAPDADPRRSFIGMHGVRKMNGSEDKTWETTFVNALRRYTGGKFTVEAGKKAFAAPGNGFVAFFDARRTKEMTVSAASCIIKNDKLSCTEEPGLDSYTLGVLTP